MKLQKSGKFNRKELIVRKAIKENFCDLCILCGEAILD
jgi:hypothetical protein